MSGLHLWSTVAPWAEAPVAPGPTTYLVDEGVGPLWAEQKDGAA